MTSDANGNLATDGGALQNQLNSNTSAIVAVQGRVTTVETSVATNTNVIAANRSFIGENSAAIENNRQSLLANTARLDNFDLRLESFASALSAQGERLNDLENGLAAVAAIPDAYLASDENYAISGGFSVVDGEVGFGGTVTLRASDRWSFGGSAGYSRGQAVGKLQFRFAD